MSLLDGSQLQELIHKILNDDLKGSELARYIRTCAAFSAAFLFTRQRSGKLSAEHLHATETGIQQLAMDAIAELFARDEQQAYFRLQQYYSLLMPSINADPDEAIFMTRRLVVAHTKQFLVRSLKDHDPVGAKIYRNLGLVPERSPEVRLERSGSVDYFYFAAQHEQVQFPDDLNPGQPEISQQFGRVLITEPRPSLADQSIRVTR